jgi:hypothetical protein
MSDPWLSIPLADYEGHMGADNVQQLSTLSGLFKRVLDICLPDSVAVLGIAGGNGLEHANPATIKRIVGVDINPGYLDEVRRRFVTHPNLELHCVDLSQDELRVAPVAERNAHVLSINADAGRELCLGRCLSLSRPIRETRTSIAERRAPALANRKDALVRNVLQRRHCVLSNAAVFY